MDKINPHNYEAYFLDFSEGNLDVDQIRELETFLEVHPELRGEFADFEPISLSDSKPKSGDWDELKKPTLDELQNDETLRETFFIRAAEGFLTGYENALFDKLIENEKYAFEFLAWKETILKPDPEVKVNPDSLYQFGLDRPLSEFNYDAWLAAKTEGLLDADQLEALSSFAKNRESGERDLKLADRLRLKPAAGIFYPGKSNLRKAEKRKIIPLWVYRAAAVAAIFLFGVFIWNQLKSPANTDKPIAEQQKPVKPVDIDTVKTGAPSDTLMNEKAQKEPQLPEWRKREPDPVQYAENNVSEPKSDNRAFKELKTIPGKKDILIYTATPEPEIARISPQEIKTPAKNQHPEYKTLPQLAEESLAEKLNVPEENQDEMANIVAQRITDKMSKMLNAEINTQTAQNDDNNTISYTLRIGNFEFSRTKKK